MKNILITMILPTTREQGGPLPIEEIRGTVLALSSDGGANWAPIGTENTPDVLQVPVNDLPVGADYQVRGIVFDTLDQASNPVFVPFEIVDDSPPGALDLTVTFP